jgi:hypothetical protein
MYSTKSTNVPTMKNCFLLGVTGIGPCAIQAASIPTHGDNDTLDCCQQWQFHSIGTPRAPSIAGKDKVKKDRELLHYIVVSKNAM